MSENGWGKGSINNLNGWGAAAINNEIGFGDSQLRSYSGETDIDGGTGIPSIVSAPVISGATTLGSTLSTTNGTWIAKPSATYTYQWYRNDSDIVGATSSTYTLVNEDGGTNITCGVTATNDFGSDTATSNTISVPAFTDADAQAFITAASITNSTQQNAINQLVVDLKANGLWTKMKAIYPFVGGTASSHKFNLKDPRDLDAAFRLVFNGGWTHNSNGITGNGVNTEALTKLIPSTYLSTTSGSLGFYLRNTIIANNYDFSSGVANAFGIALYIDTRYYMYGGFTSIGGTPSAAFYGISRVGGTHKGYRNGSVNMTSTSTATLNANELRFNANLRNYAFGYIADGLTDTENLNLYTAVQTFQTSLNRQV